MRPFLMAVAIVITLLLISCKNSSQRGQEVYIFSGMGTSLIQKDINQNKTSVLAEASEGRLLWLPTIEEDVISFTETNYSIITDGISAIYDRKILDLKTGKRQTLQQYDFGEIESEPFIRFEVPSEGVLVTSFMNSLLRPFFKREENVFYITTNATAKQIVTASTNTVGVRLKPNLVEEFIPPSDQPILASVYKSDIKTGHKEKIADLPAAFFGFDTGWGTFFPQVIVSPDGRYLVITDFIPPLVNGDSVTVVDLQTKETKKEKIIDAQGVCELGTATLEDSFLFFCFEDQWAPLTLIEVKFDNPKNQKLIGQKLRFPIYVSPDTNTIVSYIDQTQRGTKIRDIVALQKEMQSHPFESSKYADLPAYSLQFISNTELIGVFTDYNANDANGVWYMLLLNINTGTVSDLTPSITEGLINYYEDGGLSLLLAVPETGIAFYQLYEDIGERELQQTLFSIQKDGSGRKRISDGQIALSPIGYFNPKS